MRLLAILIILGLGAAAFGVWTTRAAPLPEDRFAALTGDATAGETVFYAGGCASCHAATESEDPTVLPGGRRFETEFGTFIAPNISPDPEHGLGGWTLTDFASALKAGVSPDGEHYYPAFPYTTYVRMTDQDVADLWAFMQTLPAAHRADEAHDLGFPFNIRATLGFWKSLFLNDDWVLAEVEDETLARGRYIVEAMGHCGECHTPRNALGALDTDAWLSGAPNPSGKGKIPAIDPGHLTWSVTDIAYYLETGFTPDYDSAGGEMAEVVTNTSKLSAEDRQAIAAYLKAVPAVE